VTAKMNKQDSLKGIIREVISERFGEDMVESFEIKSVQIDEDSLEIRITIEFEGDADAKELARRLFGVTRAVRKGLGTEWQDYFPVVMPTFGTGAHA